MASRKQTDTEIIALHALLRRGARKVMEASPHSRVGERRFECWLESLRRFGTPAAELAMAAGSVSRDTGSEFFTPAPGLNVRVALEPGAHGLVIVKVEVDGRPPERPVTVTLERVGEHGDVAQCARARTDRTGEAVFGPQGAFPMPDPGERYRVVTEWLAEGGRA